MIKFAIVADDNTGATDAAGMLTSRGAKVILLIDHTQLDNKKVLEGFDVIVVATRIRSIDPSEAYNRTAIVMRKLLALGIKKIQLKYCSTFDSTKQGNIGQSLDAAYDVMQFTSTIVCPALPINGRTTYMGHLFVHGTILHESPLRNHPLNPMTDSNLIRWLSYQTNKKVGLISWEIIQKGPEAIFTSRKALEKEGFVYHVTDALVQEDIDKVVQGYSDTIFLSGGSGVSESIAKLMFPGKKRLDFSKRLSASEGAVVVISGSESPIAATQRTHALLAGFKEVLIHPIAILKGRATIHDYLETIASFYKEGTSVIISLDRNNGGDVKSVNSFAESLGLDSITVGEKFGEFLGSIANSLVKDYDVKRLVVAGGETSGAVCEVCGFTALEIGLPIDPGVPYCFPQEHPEVLLVLKSGNFGRESLYADVAKLM
jgi:uncharacterized protein YgbK (DUF1537 family)